MKVGNRIICDQDGEIIVQLGEMQGNVLERKEITALHCVDLTFGEVDLMTHEMISIDMSTMKPILKEKPKQESEEQKRIRELEDAILMQTENEIGGIL